MVIIDKSLWYKENKTLSGLALIAEQSTLLRITRLNYTAECCTIFNLKIKDVNNFRLFYAI